MEKNKKRLIDLADSLVSGQGDGRLSIVDANRCYESLENDGKYTDLEKKQFSYLRHAKMKQVDLSTTGLMLLIQTYAVW